METAEIVECKEIIKINDDILLLTELVKANKHNVKALKIITKLVKTEYRYTGKLKLPISEQNFKAVQWRYTDLLGIVKSFAKVKNVDGINKGSAQLDALIGDTERHNAELKSKLNPVPDAFSAQKITEVLENTAQKISNAVGSKVSDLKKKLLGEESAK